MKTIMAVLTLGALALSTAAVADNGNKGNGHGNKSKGQYQDRGNVSGYAAAGCPPGLAKKGNGCQPPGQAKKNWARGEYLPRGYSDYTAYRDIPNAYRQRLAGGDRYRYIYQEDRVYIVDPTTRLIRDVIQLLR